MKILVLSNLYPPHHAGSFDLRCQEVTQALRERGHSVRVLTSNHGVGFEQRDAEIERRLQLNGVHGHPRAASFSALRALEIRNHAVLKETLAEFEPDVIHVWSLHGLSKSLVFGLRDCRLPTAYDVADDWLAVDVREDLWLRWWNQPQAPFLSGLWRRILEAVGQRDALDRVAPTRMITSLHRMPEVYGPPGTLTAIEPNSIAAFRFDRIYFSSHTVKSKAERAGFQVQHAAVIYPGIRAEAFAGQVRPLAAGVKKFLVLSHLTPESGILTALQALRSLRQSRISASLSVYGRGESDYVAQLRSFAVTNQLPVEFQTVSNLNRDLPAIFREHDAFLYTAEWEEPFATSPLEAMASGLPVIGAKSGGMREVLRHGENALTYSPGDAAELAARMQEIQLQPALRCQVAETGQTEVLTKFNETAVVDQIEAFLETSRQVWQ